MDYYKLKYRKPVKTDSPLDIMADKNTKRAQHRLSMLVKGSRRRKRRVRSTRIGKAWISTVFLELDHNHGFGNDDTPIVFETMIFNAKRPITIGDRTREVSIYVDLDGNETEYQTRCSTWRQALAMHREAVAMIRYQNVVARDILTDTVITPWTSNNVQS